MTFVIQSAKVLHIPTKVVPVFKKSAPLCNLHCLTAYSKNHSVYDKWKSAFKQARNTVKISVHEFKNNSKDACKRKLMAISCHEENFDSSTGIWLIVVIHVNYPM
jgi:hypothetical protein